MTRTWVLALALLAGCGRDSLSPTQREEVRALIAADRVEQVRKADEEQRQRTDQILRAEVDRAAESYHLTVEQKQGVLEVLRQQREKISQANLTEPSSNADFRERVERIYQDIESWRLGELTTRLGPEVAEQMNRETFWIAGWR